jgi:hypothetical protein
MFQHGTVDGDVSTNNHNSGNIIYNIVWGMLNSLP